MRRAKAAGMRLILHYVAIDTLDLSKYRVMLRVTLGGHGIPETDMDRRFMRSVRNLHEAARFVDEGYVYDNSHEGRFRLIAEKLGEDWTIIDNALPWLTDGLR